MFVRNSLVFAGLLLSSAALASPAGHYDFGQPAPASKATRTIEVTMTDIAFDAKELEVKAGETVRFVLVNKGQLLHEFNLGEAAMHAAHQQEMLKMQQSGMLTPTGMKMPAMDHSSMAGGAMDHGMMKHDDPNSVLVEPGKTAELTWTFSKAGSLEFACNIPGHYQAGMVGRLKIDR
ncbi:MULTISPECIES: cupredoxin domain-containing protein [Pseudomonas]|uniref:Putative copper-binding protein n=1 Tax=Pseudomonas asplenii TaxID=53407 RepID=A0A0N0VIT7_9PSED|nr:MULTISPECIES: cupredoxin family protein [Pseudomonas]KPA88919.1 putative copper-binding protein [Pseudomonas fuscovaginae]KPA94702.1 putative copper-binding protein [Pseudomonas fuscovaginae]